jgi:hypothetical protein
MSIVFSDQFNGQDLKKKASNVQTHDALDINIKKKRIEDLQMSEEARTVGPNDGNKPRGMECEGKLIEPMDEGQTFSNNRAAERSKGSSDCAIEPSLPPSINSKTKEINVAWY